MFTPHVILRSALSVDGRIDDASPRRLILSNAEEFDAVDALRAACDAVLVGAETLRRDGPRLVIRCAQRRAARKAQGLPEDPIKVTLTRSGRIDPEAEFFRMGESAKLVYCAAPVEAALRARLGATATPVPCGRGGVDLRFLLADLFARGVGRLLVEGGSTINTQFLSLGLVDELHLAVAPFFIGQAPAPPLVQPAVFPHGPARRMTLASVEKLGDMAVLVYRLARSDTPAADRHPERMRRAVELAGRCVPSDRAFSVGALLVDAAGREVAAGWSRETAPDVHAEEVALTRALAAGVELGDCTLFTSMEPCGARLSGRPSCADRIIAAGVRRVVFAWPEPPVFVQPTGAARLREAGVEVVELPEWADAAAEPNAHLIGPPGNPACQ